MKRIALGMLCLILFSGCPPKQMMCRQGGTSDMVPPPPPVTADQITPENAYEKAQALWDELDREAQQPVVQPAPLGPHPPPRR